ncbi:hypothetical protein, partial [Azospirillum sp. B4]|uniref:hypothetical protein n=1 Tax=Azospirillum sp. B4 TaxID=95605 RepID=UPI0005C8F6D3
LRILTHDVPTWFYFYRKDLSNDRHNLEYSPKLLRQLVEHGGFTVNRLWTEVFWSGDRPEIDRLLDERGYSRDLRGDDMFVLCEKSGPAGPSFPDFLYF